MPSLFLTTRFFFFFLRSTCALLLLEFVAPGLDWSSVTNKIVSCSHDRNAYVWTLNEDGAWKPTLAILRISRAALCCKWSPDGHKFAVGSGSKTVPVCQFDKEQDWWNSKIINKKRGSSVQHKCVAALMLWLPCRSCRRHRLRFF